MKLLNRVTAKPCEHYHYQRKNPRTTKHTRGTAFQTVVIAHGRERAGSLSVDSSLDEVCHCIHSHRIKELCLINPRVYMKVFFSKCWLY